MRVIKVSVESGNDLQREIAFGLDLEVEKDFSRQGMKREMLKRYGDKHCRLTHPRDQNF